MYENVIRAELPAPAQVDMSPSRVHTTTIRDSSPAFDTNTGPSIPCEPTVDRVHTGVIRDDGSGGLVRDASGVETKGRGVMATLRNNAGGLKIDSSSTVEVAPGMRTSLRVAAQLGVIKEVAPGLFVDVETAAGAGGGGGGGRGGTEMLDASEESEGGEGNGHPSHAPELFDAQDEADFAADIEPLPQHAYDSALAGAALAVNNPEEGWQKVAESLARDAGIEPELAEEYVGTAYSLFEGQVARLALAEGLNENEKLAFYEWAQAHKASDLRRAVQTLTVQRRLDGFRGLLSAFKQRAR